MLTQLLCFGAIYLVFLVHGFWLYALCVPEERTDIGTLLVVAPVLGLCVLSLYYTNTVTRSVPFSAAKVPFQVLTLLLTLAALWGRRSALGRGFVEFWCAARAVPRAWAAACCLLVLMALALLGPVLGKPLTTPWRIGPDATGYVNCARFLLEDKTLSGFSGKFTSPSEIYAYEFIGQALRIGFVSVVAAIADLFHLHPVQVIYTTAAVLMFLCLLAVARLARLFLAERHPAFPYLIAAAVAFNCNLLFILYEGGYAQIASLPLVMAMVLLQYGGIRGCDSRPRIVLLAGILLAAAAEIYLESLFIIPMLGAGYLVSEAWVRRRLAFGLRQALTVAGIVVLAFVLNWDVMSSWFRFQAENVTLLSLAGWPQPQWAYFPEIVGWVNIYRRVVGNHPEVVNAVTATAACVSLLVSLLFAGCVLASWLRGHRAGGLAVVPAAMIVGAFWYFHCHRHVHNYPYMKIYTMVLPVLTAGCLGTLLAVERLRRWTAIAVTGLTLLTVVNGVSFIRTYRFNSAFLSTGLIELKDVERTVDLSGYVLLTLPETDEHWGFREFFIRSLFSSRLIHPGFFPQQDFSDDRARPVALLVRHKGRSAVYDPRDVLWLGREYLILNTRIPLEDAWKDKGQIHWAAHPAHIPRPEIEVRWNEENRRNGATRFYDFQPYYEKGRGIPVHSVPNDLAGGARHRYIRVR